jgi:hypothetical protein
MVKFMGLGDKVLVIKSNNSAESDMATMYNALDMYISTSCSEGLIFQFWKHKPVEFHAL